ncbi:MAG: hypothetical protein RLZZ350_1580 [Verrucomicrobiota bacterium]|jgi:hypothetical protein
MAGNCGAKLKTESGKLKAGVAKTSVDRAGFLCFCGGVKLLSTVTLSVALFFLFNHAAIAATYKVGPTRKDKTLQAVAARLTPGDVVEVDGDCAYPGNVVFTSAGSADAPITVRGLRVKGHRPVISAADGNNVPVLLAFRAAHYLLEGFELDGAKRGSLARGLYLVADDLTVRDVWIHDCAHHGIHESDTGGSLTLESVEVSHCGEGLQKHQIYVASDNVKFPYAVFRMTHCYLHDGNGGNNVKSRVGRNEIYYNWIGGAKFHELDLIGADAGVQPGKAELVREDSDVVGNVFVKVSGSQGGFARLGNDGSGASDGRYRFVNNTVVLPTNFLGYVIRLRLPIQSVEWHNSVVTRIGGGPVRFLDAVKGVGGANNFFPTGTKLLPPTLTGNIFGRDAKFVDVANGDFTPAPDSPLLGAARFPTESPAEFPFESPLAEPASEPPLPGHANAAQRTDTADLGAFAGRKTEGR